MPIATPSAAFAALMRSAREQRGLTPEQVAQNLKLHPHVIRDWEEGRRTPRIGTAARWAASLDYTIKVERRT